MILRFYGIKNDSNYYFLKLLIFDQALLWSDGNINDFTYKTHNENHSQDVLTTCMMCQLQSTFSELVSHTSL